MNATDPRPSIYEMVLLGLGEHAAERLRYRIADEAASDPDWRVLYDDVLDTGQLMPEQVRAGTRAHHVPGRALSPFGEAPTHKAALLWARVVELGEPATMPDLYSLVAAVAAGEIWLAAVGGTNFNCAASMGCDAISSLAALLARSVGEGVEVGSEPIERTGGPADAALLAKACAEAKAWACQMAGEHSWPEIRAMIATDLSWDARGGSLTRHAASIAAAS